MASSTAKSAKDVNLMLIGKTGNGKSSTGNMILRKYCFKSQSSTTSVTKRFEMVSSKYKGRTISIVDGPGIGDTDLNNRAALNLVRDGMKRIIASTPLGYHAFLLVIRFGGRFTKEDREAVHRLKVILGPDVIQKYCILCITCGDNFNVRENGDFKKWCIDQSGSFKSLVEECGKRVILFNNKTKDESIINRQIDELLHVLDRHTSSGLCYTNKQFNAAQSQ